MVGADPGLLGSQPTLDPTGDVSHYLPGGRLPQ